MSTTTTTITTAKNFHAILPYGNLGLARRTVVKMAVHNTM